MPEQAQSKNTSGNSMPPIVPSTRGQTPDAVALMRRAEARAAIAAFTECDELMKGQLHAFQSHPVVREGIMRVRVRIAQRIQEEKKWLNP